MAVRREAVRLEVEGSFAEQMLADAAAVDVLQHKLHDLNGTTVGSTKATSDFDRATKDAARDTEDLGKKVEQNSSRFQRGKKDLDSYTGRLGLLTSAIASVAPAAIPLGALGAGGVAALANDMGAAALAGGSLIVAFHGVGKALTAVNTQALDPSAAHLKAAKIAMEQISPAAQGFVRQLQSMRPLLLQIQQGAASGWFPGLTKALGDLAPLLPVVEKIFHDVGTMGGNLLAEGAKALAGPEWRSFFAFVDREAPKAMEAMGRVVGSLAHGIAQLGMAFGPLTNSFNGWLEGAARDFDKWATGLSKTQGFHDFIDYLHQTGPKVGQALGAIANAVLQIVQATAPLAGPTLDAITAIANAIAKIADSPLGTPIMALIQMAGVARLASTAVGGVAKALAVVAGESAVGGAAGARAATGAAAAEGVTAGGFLSGARGGLSTMARLALPVYAAGAVSTAGFNAVGNYIDPAAKTLGTGSNIQAIVDSIRKSTGFKGVLGGALADPAKLIGFNPDHIGDKGPYQQADAQLGQLVASGNAKKAAEIFAQINAQVSDAAKYFPKYADAVKQYGNAEQQAAAQAEKHRQATIAGFDAETNYREALAAATAQAKTNSKGINGNSQAALANRTALAGLRDAWNNQTNAVKSNVVRQAQAREQFIKTATAMGVPIAQAKRLADQLDHIPTHVNPVVKVFDDASAPISRIRAELAALHDKTVNVWVKQYTAPFAKHTGPSFDPSASGAIPGGGAGFPHSALGGTVMGRRMPYGDKVLTWLAPGEEVISNRYGQADRHRALLKAINANRAADGATVGRVSSVTQTVRHVIDVRVTGDALDLTRAKQQIHATVREIARDEIDQDHSFWNRD